MRDELDVAALRPITLAELERTAELLTRTDRKYIVPLPTAQRMLSALAETHRALEIDRRRAFAYSSVYLDSPSLGAFRAHMQQRRRRYKCRTRHYVDADVHMFEVKLKGPRGTTVKHQLPIAAGNPHAIGADALAFAAARVREEYGLHPERLEPTIRSRYTRITLACDDRRVTLDYGLSFEDGQGRSASMNAGYVIVESKSLTGAGAADVALKRMGIRPVQCSKYCIGVALLREDAKANALRWLLRRYFCAAPHAGASYA